MDLTDSLTLSCIVLLCFQLMAVTVLYYKCMYTANCEAHVMDICVPKMFQDIVEGMEYEILRLRVARLQVLSQIHLSILPQCMNAFSYYSWSMME